MLGEEIVGSKVKMDETFLQERRDVKEVEEEVPYIVVPMGVLKGYMRGYLEGQIGKERGEEKIVYYVERESGERYKLGYGEKKGVRGFLGLCGEGVKELRGVVEDRVSGGICELQGEELYYIY